MPEISVVVPVYKIENYLSTCVDSILAQTFQDLEVILVDDGSPDCCGEICDSYAKRDERVRVIHQKNAGLSCARNAGATRSTGKYICFIDGDDYLLPEYCETLLALLKNSHCDFSACGVCRFHDGEAPHPQLQDGEPVTLSNVDYLKEQLYRRKEFGVWNRLYRRELFETIRFFPGKIHEDVIFSADLAQLHGGAIVTDKQLYCYRQRSNSIVAEGKKRCSPDFVFAGDHLIKAAKESFPGLYDQCLCYAVEYPWMFVDGIYVDRTFSENRAFLSQLRQFVREHFSEYRKLKEIASTIRKRMLLFSISPVLYGFNAYARLFRVYLYRIIGKDAYADGHGI